MSKYPDVKICENLHVVRGKQLSCSKVKNKIELSSVSREHFSDIINRAVPMRGF